MKSNPQLSKARWVQEYLQGARMEIYGDPLSDNFIGFDYAVATCNIFEKYGSILFGVKIVDPASRDTKTVLLNPQGYIFKGGEIGYFIATNARDSTKIGQEGPGMEGPSYFDHDSPLSDRSRVSRVSPGAPSKHGSQEDIIPISPTAYYRDTAVITMEQEDVKRSKQKGKDQSFRDHILVCDLDNKFPSTLASFLGPLRVREPRRTVVILCSQSPSKQQWSNLESFGNVHYVQGSSLSRADLKKASVETAWKAVILAKEDTKGYLL
jgi:hypothetical protein